MSSDVIQDARKRKHDNKLNESGKRMRTSGEVIELSSDSDEMKIENEVCNREKSKSSESCLSGTSHQKINPTGFFISKVVNGIDEKYNNEFTLSINEILSKDFNKSGKLKSSCQFSYIYNVDWLVGQYDEEYRNLPMTIVAQMKQPTIDEMRSACEKYSNIDLCFARLLDQWGTHHSKFMLLDYDNGFRVVIHTANLRPDDWKHKTQGIWCSELLPRLSENQRFEDKSKTHFQTDLIEYLEAYNCQPLKKWIATIKRHDFSSVNVLLIGSIPGRHKDSKLNKFGHMKVRKILKEHGLTSMNKEWSVMAQFSSIGTLGKSPDTWLSSEFLDSLKAIKPVGPSSISTKPGFKIIFPTTENVRLSLEGYMAGASIPYSHHVAVKQTWLKSLMHQWKADINGRTKAQPHIKSYARLSSDGDEIAYLILTSANLSKAAWGALEKNASQLNIRSWELGVMFLPKFYGPFDTFKRSKELCISGNGTTEIISIPLPYDFPLQPYKEEDNPWVLDLPYLIPDSHGNIWNPTCSD